jgi:hypothetical protein
VIVEERGLFAGSWEHGVDEHLTHFAARLGNSGEHRAGASEQPRGTEPHQFAGADQAETDLGHAESLSRHDRIVLP